VEIRHLLRHCLLATTRIWTQLAQLVPKLANSFCAAFGRIPSPMPIPPTLSP
jgi:hypothetical protein